MKLIYLDTETTGAAEEDRILQLSFAVYEQKKLIMLIDELCIPPLPIKTEAMATHHITPEMLEGHSEFAQLQGYAQLQELNTPENIIIGHNIVFDLTMLQKEGFENHMQVIDTMKVLAKEYPEFESFSQQYARYALKLYKNGFEDIAKKEFGLSEIRPHDALSDICILSALTRTMAKERGLGLDAMVEISKKPIEFKYMRSAKYRGKSVEEVAKSNAGYLLYMLGQDDLDANLRYTYEQALKRFDVDDTISFGKHQGKTYRELARSPERDYLVWLAENANNPAQKELAKLVLAQSA